MDCKTLQFAAESAPWGRIWFSMLTSCEDQPSSSPSSYPGFQSKPFVTGPQENTGSKFTFSVHAKAPLPDQNHPAEAPPDTITVVLWFLHCQDCTAWVLYQNSGPRGHWDCRSCASRSTRMGLFLQQMEWGCGHRSCSHPKPPLSTERNTGRQCHPSTAPTSSSTLGRGFCPCSHWGAPAGPGECRRARTGSGVGTGQGMSSHPTWGCQNGRIWDQGATGC